MLPKKEALKRPLLRLLLAIGRLLPRPRRRPAIPVGDLKSILVFQDGGLGDVLRAFPMIEALRERFPKARIGLLMTQKFDVLSLLPDRSPPCELLLIDLRQGYQAKLAQLREIRQRGFDLILNSSRGDGVLECAAMSWLIGARWRVGFEANGSGFLYTHTEPFSETESILVQNARLLRHIGIEIEPPNIELGSAATDEAYARDLLAPFVGDLVVSTHPWAVSHSDFRSWGSENFAALLRYLIATHHARVLLLGSPGEREWAVDLATRIDGGGRVVDLTGRTTLAQSSALIRHSQLFLGNDSSLLHLASAWMVPSLAIFGATSPQQVLPPVHRCEILQTDLDLPCQPCYRHQPLFAYRCDHGFACLQTLTVDHAIGRVARMLTREPQRLPSMIG